MVFLLLSKVYLLKSV